MLKTKKVVVILLSILAIISCAVFLIQLCVIELNEKDVSFWIERNFKKADKYLEKAALPIEDKNDVILISHRINDNDFYKKLDPEDGMAKYISNDVFLATYINANINVSVGDKEPIYVSTYNKETNRWMFTAKDVNAGSEKPLKEWISTVGEILQSDIIGEIYGVDFLYFTSSEEAWEIYHCGIIFAYINTENGEFLVPYVLFGDSGLENGKLYEIHECATIMQENIKHFVSVTTQ